MRTSYQDKRGGGKSFGGGRSFDRKPSFGGQGGRGGKSFGGPKTWERGPMHTATCGKCGNECQVPFKPNGSRPVLCNFCFRQDGGPEQKFADKPFRGNSSFGEKRSFSPERSASPNIEQQLREINEKLDTIIAAIEDEDESEA